MNKETDAIPITLVLPRYEVMGIIYALQRWADREDSLGHPSSNITALADKIHSEVREQVMAFEDQAETENPNPK